MKRRIIIIPILLAMLIPSLSLAQTSTVAKSPNLSTTKKVLIEKYNYYATVSCANSGYDSVTFIYSDGSMQSGE